MAKSDRKLGTLFFQLEANTAGLQGDLASAERSFGRFTKFVVANPVAAIGALGAAAIGAGLKAAEMATQFDAAARRIAAVLPNGTARLEDLKRAADRLAVTKGLPADRVLGGLQAIAKEGVTSLEALIARFEILQRVADATSTELTALAGPFDQILDVFDLGDQDLERVAATLAKLSQDRGVGFEELISVFKAAAPAIREANLSFEEGAAVLSRFLAEGRTAKQSTTELKDELKKMSGGFRETATLGFTAAEAISELDTRAALLETSTERLRGALSEQFASALRTTIGPAFREHLVDPLWGGVQAMGILLAQGRLLRALAGDMTAFFPDPVPGAAAAAAGFRTGFTVDRGQRLGARDRPPVVVTPDQQKAADAFAQTLAEASARASATLVDDLLLVLTDFEAKYKASTAGLSQTAIDQANAQLAQLRAQVEAVRRFEAAPLTPNVRTPVSGPRAIRTDAALLAQATEDAADQAERYKREMLEAQRALEESRDRARRQADEIERSARAAIQLAEAFGLLDDNMAKVLTGIGQVAATIKRIQVDGFSFTNVLSLAGAGASILSGLFGGGPSADEVRDREIREANTKAIRELTRTLSDQVAGTTVASASAGVEALLGAGAGGLGREGGAASLLLDRKKVEAVLAPLGLSFEQFKNMLEALNPGLKLNTSSVGDFRDSLEQMQEAIKNVDLRAFAEDFASQLSLLQTRFDLLDLTNPLDQLKDLQRLGAQTSPVLKELLGSLDLTTAAGRTAAEAELLAILDKLGTVGGLTGAELGNLSPAQLADLIRQLEGLIDAVNEQQGTVTGGAPRQETFGVERKITDVQADRLISLAVSQDVHLVEIRDLMARVGAFVPVLPPAFPSELLGSGRGGIVVQVGGVTLGGITVEVTGALDPATAAAVGTTIGLTAADALSQALGRQLQLAKIRAGDALVS